jgi:hypothetical protein
MTEKWDCQGRSIDLTGKKRLVVVDFDNTCMPSSILPLLISIVFRTPLPNRNLWSKNSIDQIFSDRFFLHGGW